jgi:hypothetical protein
MREYRDPPSQASVVIIDHLRELGLLKARDDRPVEPDAER